MHKYLIEQLRRQLSPYGYHELYLPDTIIGLHDDYSLEIVVTQRSGDGTYITDVAEFVHKDMIPHADFSKRSFGEQTLARFLTKPLLPKDAALVSLTEKIRDALKEYRPIECTEEYDVYATLSGKKLYVVKKYYPHFEARGRSS